MSRQSRFTPNGGGKLAVGGRRFLNSTVPQLAEVILTYEMWITKMSAMPIVESDAILASSVEELRSEFERIDPESVINPYCCWSEVLEGLMI